jgi:hypothetical protein
VATTLIFPACVPDGERYAEAARERGEHVVAASSLTYDETARKFDTWFFLPSIYADDFIDRLNEAIQTYGITRIYCPASVVYTGLRRLIAEAKLSVPLVGDMPRRRDVRRHRALITAAAELHAFIQSLTIGRSDLTVIDVASVLRQALGIFGESDEFKLAAMMAIFADAPRGDIVEIGVLAGRSACVLALMAQRHATGSVLVVDPWSDAELIQHDSPKDLRTMVDDAECAVPIECFLVSLLPIADKGAFNYLAMPSDRAHVTWSQERRVQSGEFGEVHYRGTIAVLHIDGNHDHASVRKDCFLWVPHVAPGGWLILDDYVWFHGDGPRTVGDALLADRAGDVQRAFVCGNALFVKFAD